jgi:hypothetical protein
MIDVERIIGMLQARRTAAYKAAQTDTTGCQQTMVLEYEELLAEITMQQQNHEKPMDTE